MSKRASIKPSARKKEKASGTAPAPIDRLKHQLNIHLDFVPPASAASFLEIRYSYPYSGEHLLSEQVLRLDVDDIDQELLAGLRQIYDALVARIPKPRPIRLPHAKITPKINPAILTLVVLDQSRAHLLPLARLYYHGEVPELQSRNEQEVRVEKLEWTRKELVTANRIRDAVRKLAWDDYKQLVGDYFFKEN